MERKDTARECLSPSHDMKSITLTRVNKGTPNGCSVSPRGSKNNLVKSLFDD